MKKIIISSLTLLNKINAVEYLTEETYYMVFKDGEFYFPNIEGPMYVTANTKEFSEAVEGSSIQSLKMLLRQISDQPLTLGFGRGRWITICEALL